MSSQQPEELPAWRPGAVAILSTGGGAPHAIPVSTAVRAGPRTVVLALARRRESLARLRADPHCALTVVEDGNVAFTARARATIVADPLPAAERVAAVRLEVERIQDHRQRTFEIDAGARWHWTDAEAEDQDAVVRAALVELAAAAPEP